MCAPSSFPRPRPYSNAHSVMASTSEDAPEAPFADFVVSQCDVGDSSNSWKWLQTHILEGGGQVVVAAKEKWKVLEIKGTNGKAQVVGVFGPTPVGPGRYCPPGHRRALRTLEY